MNSFQVYEKDSLEPTPETKLQKKVLYSDKIYSYAQKFTFLKWNLAGSIFLVFSSILQIFFLYSSSWNVSFGKTYLSVLMFLSLFYGALSFFTNICLFRHEFIEVRQIFISLSLKFLGVLFILSSFFMVAKFLAIFIFLLSFRYNSTASTVEIISISLISLDGFTLGFSIFAYFTIEGSKSTVRVLLYISGLIIMGFAFILMFLCGNVSNVISTEKELNTVIISYSFTSLKGMSLCSIVVIEIIFLFSLRKFNFWFFIGANWTLVIAVLFGLLNGFLIKNLHQINAFFKTSENCVNALKYFKSEYLETVECAEKYLEASQAPYLNCSINEQAFIWESPVNWAKSGCINMGCCNETLSIIYFSEIMYIYLLSLGIIVIGFVLIACVLYQTSLYMTKSFEYQISSWFNKLMTVLYILTPICGIIFLLYTPQNLPQKQAFFPLNYQSNSSNLAQYPVSATDYTPSCFLLSDYLTNFNPKLSLSKCVHTIEVNGTETCNDDMRVVLLIQNGQIYIPLDYNNESLRIFDQRSKNFVFAQKTQNYDSIDYFAFEGSLENVKDFMQNTVQVCPNSLFETISYSYSTYQVGSSSYPLSSNQSSNSTIATTVNALQEKYRDNINTLSETVKSINHNKEWHRSDSDNTTTNISIIDFNLTDNGSFKILGRLLGNTDDTMDGANVCFTEENPESGSSYQCLLETTSDSNGVFTLEVNQLKNNVAFRGYLEFWKNGYYPLQIDLLFSGNNQGIINLGYIQMNPMNNTINETNSSSKGKTSASSTTDYSSDSLSNLQLQLNNIKFGDLTLNVLDMVTLDPLNHVYLTLYSSAVDCKNNLAVESLGSFYTKDDENLTFYNLEYNTYTFFFSSEKYKTGCVQTTIDSPSHVQTVLLSPLLEDNQLRILLQWENSDLNLGLFLMFKTNDNSSKCVVSFQNKNCLGVELIMHQNLNGTNAQIITINSLQNLTYLTYVKEIISLETYNQRKNETLNTNFLYYSKLILRYYVAELELPVEISNGVSIDKTYNMTEVLSEENLAYFFVCLKGGVGDVAKVPGKTLWTKSYYDKTQGNEYPESEVCQM